MLNPNMKSITESKYPVCCEDPLFHVFISHYINNVINPIRRNNTNIFGAILHQFNLYVQA